MLVLRRISLVLYATLFVVLLACATALAAPITVNLRVEGSEKTLFEGPVSTEAILKPPGIATESSTTPEPCDVSDNGSNGGFVTAAATPTTALYDAAVASGLTFNAEWSTEFDDFLITQVGGDVSNSGNNGEYWGYAVNFTTAEVGGCQIRLAPGSEVLWAYNFFGLPHLLSLTGPSSVEVGVPFTVHVTDGQTGEPISGAAIGEDIGGVTTPIPSSPLTDANGNATITLTQTGTVRLKATQPESVRSNGLTVNVAIVPCACALILPRTSKVKPNVTDLARITGVMNDHVYSRRSDPRVLAGVVSVPAGGTLRDVRISLKRSYRGHCFDFSGTRERFVHIKCRHTAQFFSVGDAESFSYLLPTRLPAGRYIYDIEAINDAGQATKLVSGVSRVVFRVK